MEVRSFKRGQPGYSETRVYGEILWRWQDIISATLRYTYCSGYLRGCFVFFGWVDVVCEGRWFLLRVLWLVWLGLRLVACVFCLWFLLPSGLWFALDGLFWWLAEPFQNRHHPIIHRAKIIGKNVMIMMFLICQFFLWWALFPFKGGCWET